MAHRGFYHEDGSANTTHLFPSATATITGVASLNTNQTLLNANADRIGLIIENTDANTLYIKFGATAAISAGNWSVAIPTNTRYVMEGYRYTGRIDGIWSADGSGLAQITELT